MHCRTHGYAVEALLDMLDKTLMNELPIRSRILASVTDCLCASIRVIFPYQLDEK